MKDCFGVELANRFFSGAYSVDSEDATERSKKRLECYKCPDFEHCYQVLDLVYKLRLAEEAKRSGAKPIGRVG